MAAKNVIPHPSFPVDDKGAWSGDGLLAIRSAGLDGGDAYRLPCNDTGSPGYASIDFPKEGVSPGDKLYLWILYANNDTSLNSMEAIVEPRVNSGYYLRAAGGNVSLPSVSGYVQDEFYIQLPPWESAIEGFTTADLDSWRISIGGDAGYLAAFSFIRLDTMPVEKTGYFAGDTPDTSAWDYSWDGVAYNSASSATDATAPPPPVVTVDPVPDQVHVVGDTVSLQLTGSTTAGDPALTWTTDVLPGGLSLTGDTISGTLTTAATVTTTVTATDATMSTATELIGWTTEEAPRRPPVVTVDPVPDQVHVVGDTVSLQLTGSTTAEDTRLIWSTEPLPDGLELTGGGTAPDGLYLPGDTISGTLTAAGSGTTEITATDTTGAFQSGEIMWTVTAEGDPAPAPPATTSLGEKIATFLGRTGDPDTIGLASAHALIVTEYVRGYTRDSGFNTDGSIAPPLEAVIVSTTARLTANPEQVTNYTSGDYSERPAVLSGWKLHELAILHRYRKRSA